MHFHAVLGEGFSWSSCCAAHPGAAPGAELSSGDAGREALLWAQWLDAAPGGCHGVWVIPAPSPV